MTVWTRQLRRDSRRDSATNSWRRCPCGIVLTIPYTPSRRDKLYPARNPAAIRVSRRESRRYWAASAGYPAGIRQFRRDSAFPPGLASPGEICIPVPKHRESPLLWPRSGMKSIPPGFTSVPGVQNPSSFNICGISAGISLVPPGFPPGFRSISAGFPHL